MSRASDIWLLTLGEIHVSSTVGQILKIQDHSQDTSTGTVHGFSDEVLLEGAITLVVVQQRNVAVGGESSRPTISPRLHVWSGSNSQHRDITEDRFEWFIKDVTHLVLEILRSDKRIQQVLPEHALESDNLATGATN